MRIVVKIGTSSLCQEDGKLDESRVAELAGQILTVRAQGHEVVVVTSGAVGAGIGRIGLSAGNIREKQALAAVGQSLLVQAYQRHLGEVPIGQVLITRSDLEDPTRRDSCYGTLMQLVAWGVIPLINENDVVADEEIRIGDNDTLAARMAVLARADLLILLSDVEGLFTGNPRTDPEATPIASIRWVMPEHVHGFGQGVGRFGTGGIETKLEAALIAQSAGIPMVLAHSHEEAVLVRIVAGEGFRGTRFLAGREGDWWHVAGYAEKG